MYFGSFQQLSFVNTGFPPSKVPIRRKLGQDEVRQDREHRLTCGALDTPDGESTQTDTDVMRVAGQAPAPATGGLMFQLQAKGEEEGEHTFDKRLAVAEQLKIGRFVQKINGDGPVFAGLRGSGSHASPSGPRGS
jgi:hypothetical protein